MKMRTEKKKLVEQLPAVLTQEQRLALLEAKLKRAEATARAIAEQAKTLRRF
jgi:hypothetical protein